MPSQYTTTSNVRYDENIMTSHVRHSERGSAISDCIVIIMFSNTPAQCVLLLLYLSGDILHDMHIQPIVIERVSFTFTSFTFRIQ